MRNATLLFLIKRKDGKADEICLAMKKRGFGAGRWNGAGGKSLPGETPEQAVARETEEELLVRPKSFSKVAELTFIFPERPEWNQLVHTYICEEWHGEPRESEEMRPRWFSVVDIPYREMWPDDPLWLPLVISGKHVKAEFVFGEKDTLLDHKVTAARFK